MSGRVEHAARVGIMLGLGAVGAAAGFEHTHDWAVKNGQHGWLAWADAVVIESMAVMAGLEIRRDKRIGRSSRLPMVVLAAAFLLQMAAQVALAPKTLPGWLLAAVPALGFLVVVKLAMRPEPANDQPPAVVAPVAGSVMAEAERLPASLPEPIRELLPSSRVAVPMTAGMVWLPVAVRDQVITSVTNAVETGIEVTPELLVSAGVDTHTAQSLVGEIKVAMNEGVKA